MCPFQCPVATPARVFSPYSPYAGLRTQFVSPVIWMSKFLGFLPRATHIHVVVLAGTPLSFLPSLDDALSLFFGLGDYFPPVRQVTFDSTRPSLLADFFVRSSSCMACPPLPPHLTKGVIMTRSYMPLPVSLSLTPPSSLRSPFFFFTPELTLFVFCLPSKTGRCSLFLTVVPLLPRDIARLRSFFSYLTCPRSR